MLMKYLHVLYPFEQEIDEANVCTNFTVGVIYDILMKVTFNR
jgi:hypothetical protein